MPCLLKVFGSDSFTNTIGQTSLNNVCTGPTVLSIISLSERMQRQVENIGKSKVKLGIIAILKSVDIDVFGKDTL